MDRVELDEMALRSSSGPGSLGLARHGRLLLGLLLRACKSADLSFTSLVMATDLRLPFRRLKSPSSGSQAWAFLLVRPLMGVREVCAACHVPRHAALPSAK